MKTCKLLVGNKSTSLSTYGYEFSALESIRLHSKKKAGHVTGQLRLTQLVGVKQSC